ncbi:MAG TPA: DUF983 domain-containing protein [Acidimicrobiales bacterium]|nr:DUF983 domain-containing protein [Acidimicrobiales bacterium]
MDPRPTLMLLRGLCKRCPRCGGGKLFRGWLQMKPLCPRCGMCFEREEGFFLGAFVVNFGVMLLSLALFIVIGVASTMPDPPPGKLAAAGMLVGVLVPILFYPMSRTFWSAIDLIMKPLEPQEIESATTAVRRAGG